MTSLDPEQRREAPHMDDDMRAWRDHAEIVIAGTLVRERAALQKVIALEPFYGTYAREVAASIVQALEWQGLAVVGGPAD